MSGVIGVLIEVVVAILLLVAIRYCAVLNKRLCRFKADEHLMKNTVAELAAATEAAERAIGSLKTTLQNCEGHLDSRMAGATELAERLKTQIELGQDVVERVARSGRAGREKADPEPRLTSTGEAPHILSAKSVAAAAHALAERHKPHGRSA